MDKRTIKHPHSALIRRTGSQGAAAKMEEQTQSNYESGREGDWTTISWSNGRQ